jgi:hypothetical protein
MGRPVKKLALTKEQQEALTGGYETGKSHA